MDVETPPLTSFIGPSNIIMMAESHAVHRVDLESRASEYNSSAYARFSAGATISPQELNAARSECSRLTAAMERAMDGLDILLLPTSLGRPGRLDDPPRRVFTRPFSVTGQPALAVPARRAGRRIPLSLQIVGRRFDDRTVLAAGHAIESLFG